LIIICRLEKDASPENAKKAAELRYRMFLLESKIKEMQRYLPSSAG